MKMIDKAALVAEIERKRNDYINSFMTEQVHVLNDVLDFLDTLEVKEVDLEEEIKEEYLKRRCYGGRDNMLVILNEPEFNTIAKHFFELGVKVAQKGEEV